jgi:hypothetical protein
MEIDQRENKQGEQYVDRMTFIPSAHERQQMSLTPAPSPLRVKSGNRKEK